MNSVLTSASPFAAANLYDVMIFRRKWTDFLQHFRVILTKLRKAGLIAKLDKCQLGMNECQFLGHMVGDDVINSDGAKIAPVHKFREPK